MQALLLSHDLDLVVVGVADIKRLVSFAVVDTEWVLKLRLVTSSFDVTKIEKVQTIVIRASYISCKICL